MPLVATPDVDLYVEETGSGPPLLLIMGLGASIETWVAQRDAFARHHRVITFDNRGAGRSGCPSAPWTVPAMAEDARAVLDALDIPRAHVLGVSMGGMIAQELAIAHPERVARLVVALSFARPEPLRRTFLLHRCWARLQGAEPVSESIAHLPWLLSPATMNDGTRLAEILDVVGAMPFMAPEAYARQVDAILEHRDPGAPERGACADARPRRSGGRADTGRVERGDRGRAFRERGSPFCHAADTACIIEYADDFNRAVLDWLGRPDGGE